MESVAVRKYIRISSRKIARLANECVGKKLSDVKSNLKFFPQKSSRELYKTIQSAESNYLFKNQNANTDVLKVKLIYVEAGPSFKRLLTRSRGSADRIEKKTSHIRVVLTDEK